MDAVSACPGPLIWYSVPDNDGHEDAAGAVLECATCPYVIVAGSFNDDAHTDTPLLREGLT